jgi:serine/threonine protein kinase
MSQRPLTGYNGLTAALAQSVDQACDRLEEAWQAGQCPELEAYLEDVPEDVATVLLRELILVDASYRVRAGQPVQPGDYQTRFPDLEPAWLEAALAGGDTAGPTWVSRPVSGRARSPQSTSVRPTLPVIPGYALLDELGRGGMGVVYKARDTTLGRLVALKVPRAEALADSLTRMRFQNEARAAAGLDHANLVPVYEAGEAGPICFIASAYCPGITLAAWLKRHTEPVPAAAAALVATLADGVHHAHVRGILHRDLKPANVMLTPLHASDSTNEPADLTSAVPKILDFGLAKQLPGVAGPGSGAGPTMTGQILGTPSYMAPEQTGGKADIGPPTDVYALGAILYELLTLRPPFAGDSILEILEQVRSVEPVPPGRLRVRVPRDLETICLKCLRKEPVRRYATAQDLADDLRRFQDGKPVRARPVSAGERFVAWCRRSPKVAALLAALGLVFLAGTSGVLWQWHRATSNAADAERNAANYLREWDTARQQKTRAEHHLQLVRERVEHLDKLGRELLGRPGQFRAGQAVLQEALAFYKKLLPGEGDPSVRREAARLYRQVAVIHDHLGQTAQAADAYGRVANLLNGLLDDDPSSKDLRMESADVHRWWGHELSSMGNAREAREAYRLATRLHEGLVDDFPGDPVCQMALAGTLLHTADLLQTRDHAEKLEPLYSRIVALDRKAAGAAPDNPDIKAELALALESQALFLVSRGRNADAEADVREALEIHQGLLDDGYLRGSIERYLARNYVNLGRVLFATKGAPEAEKYYRKAVALLEPPVEEFPESVLRRADLARTMSGLAGLLKDPGRRQEAREIRQSVVRRYQTLKADFPENPHYQRCLAATYLDLASLLCELGQPSEAAELCRQALELEPDDDAVNNNLAWILATSPEPRLGDAAQAVRLATKAARANPKIGFYHNTLGVAHYRNGDDKAAVDELTKSMNLRQGGNSFDWFPLAMAHWRLGHPDQARTWFDRAVQWMDKNRPQDDDLRRFRAEAQALLAGPPRP